MEPYQLTPEENAGLNQLASQVSATQIKIYSLNSQLEIAMKERDAAEARFNGALTFVMMLHGISGGTLSADLTKIAPAQKAE